MIEMSLEAHQYFLQKIERADSLETVVVDLEKSVKALQDSMELKQKDFVRMLVESDRIRSQLEQTRFALSLEVKDLERQLRLLKLSHRQRRAILRKYYPKLTRDQRFRVLLVAIPAFMVAIIIGLSN